MVKSAMVLKILQIGDERLLKVSEKITDFSDKSLHKLVSDMIDTCKSDEEHTAGLAAPQVGENIRLTVVRRMDQEEEQRRSAAGATDDNRVTPRAVWEPLYNPKIVAKDEEYDSLVWEACLSIGEGDKQLFGPVYRPNWVEVSYQDGDGTPKTIKAKGFFSHLLQHEIDHLNGVLFTSHVQNPTDNLWLSKELDEYIAKNGKYPPVQ
jgi:peptide deformylase